MPDRIPPHNLDAERAVLGSILVNPDSAMPLALEWLEDESGPFYRDAHQVIWDAMVDIWKKGVNVDLVTLHDHLGRIQLLDVAGGREYIAGIAAEVSTSATIEYHAQILADLAQQRMLWMVANQILSSTGKVESAVNLTDMVQGHLDKLALRARFRDQGVWKRGVHIRNVYDADRMLEEYRKHVVNLQQNTFKTGVKPIDSLIRGVAGGELLFIIARAGSFKTAFLQNMLLRHSLKADVLVPFFSIEMPVASVTERFHQIIQTTTGRDIESYYQRLPESSENVEDIEKFFKETLNNLLVIPARVGIMDIVRYIQLIEKKWGKKVGAIGIDYLGLMEGKGKDAYAKTSQLVVDLKAMAKAVNLPVIAISQTSRKGGHGEIEIEMDMARDSGAIEEAADFAIGMYSVPADPTNHGQASIIAAEEDEDVPSIVICKILKNRKGPKNRRFILDLDKATFRILEDAKPYTPEKKSKPQADAGFEGAKEIIR